jgi:septum formation protein
MGEGSGVRPLILASASPRRRELLAGLGLQFIVRAADIDETPRTGETPSDYVLRLAREKAAVAAQAGPGDELVLAADTTVVVDGEILGKPEDEADARRMLRQLSGREHEVLTGVALLEISAQGNREASHVERSVVRMASLSDDEIAWWVAAGECLDRAGAYAIQGFGALFVDAVSGNYTNVVGLPIPAVYHLFAALGFDLKALSSAAFVAE